MKWFRLYSEARTDEKLRSLTDSEFRTWFRMLCYSSEQTERGTIPAANRFKVAVEVSSGDEELFEETVKKLVRLEMVDDTGDFITLVHFKDRQYDKPSDTPERSRERKRQSRQRRADVTPSHATDTDTDTDTKNRNENKYDSLPANASERLNIGMYQTSGAQPNQVGNGHKAPAENLEEYSPEFEMFWREYPRKAEKKAAYKEWKQRIKTVASSDLIFAAKQYADYCVRERIEPKYIKHPKTFIGPDMPFEEFLSAKHAVAELPSQQQPRTGPYIPSGIPPIVAARLEELRKHEQPI